MDNFYEVLKNGVILCKLVNTLEPGRIKKVNETKMAFKCMENISAFLEAVKSFGVPVQETFQSVDLWERQNLNSVVICLQSLGRKVRKLLKNPKKCSKISHFRLTTSTSPELVQRSPRRMSATSAMNSLKQVKMWFHYSMAQTRVPHSPASTSATLATCKFDVLPLTLHSNVTQSFHETIEHFFIIIPRIF